MTIINNFSIKDESVRTSDICIIGSGMSAQVLAFKLGSNKKITIVESGKFFLKKKFKI